MKIFNSLFSTKLSTDPADAYTVYSFPRKACAQIVKQ